MPRSRGRPRSAPHALSFYGRIAADQWWQCKGSRHIWIASPYCLQGEKKSLTLLSLTVIKGWFCLSGIKKFLGGDVLMVGGVKFYLKMRSLKVARVVWVWHCLSAKRIFLITAVFPRISSRLLPCLLSVISIFTIELGSSTWLQWWVEAKWTASSFSWGGFSGGASQRVRFLRGAVPSGLSSLSKLAWSTSSSSISSCNKNIS